MQARASCANCQPKGQIRINKTAKKLRRTWYKRLLYNLTYSVLELYHYAYLAHRVYRVVISKSRVHQFVEAFYGIRLIKSFLELKSIGSELSLAYYQQLMT